MEFAAGLIAVARAAVVEIHVQNVVGIAGISSSRPVVEGDNAWKSSLVNIWSGTGFKFSYAPEFFCVWQTPISVAGVI